MSKPSRRSVFLSALVGFALMPLGAGLAAEAGKGPYQGPRFENFRWVIFSYFDGRALVDSHDASTIAFVNGRIQGRGGCGAFGGDYILSGSIVRIRAETVLSDGPCFQANLLEAQAVLDALNSGVRSIEERADRVVLRDSNGAVQIVLTPGE